MASAIWDYCTLDNDALDILSKLNHQPLSNASAPSSSSKSASHHPHSSSDYSSAHPHPQSVDVTTNKQSKTDEVVAQSELNHLESTCAEFLSKVDSSLRLINDITKDYHDVTSRTNTLIQKCENLLEQQHTLQTTVESLNAAFQPFNDIEAIGDKLGIPLESSVPRSGFQVLALSVASAPGTASLDPRSPEFQDILQKLATAIIYIHEHSYYRDYEAYRKWLEQLQMRATSLVARSMRELLDSVGVLCKDLASKQAAKKIRPNPDDTPLESAPVYQKFRGLSYRMRELSSLLQWNRVISQQVAYRSSDSGGRDTHGQSIARRYEGFSNTTYQQSSRSAVEEIALSVQQAYVILRTELIIPLIKDQIAYYVNQTHPSASKSKDVKRPVSIENISTTSSSAEVPQPTEQPSTELVTISRSQSQESSLSVTSTNSGSAPTNLSQTLLSGHIRRAFTSLVRIAQLEYQLYDSLFRKTAAPISIPGQLSPSTALTTSDDSHTFGIQDDVSEILQSISNATIDALRPLIIREADVDELCRVVLILADDLRSQILSASSLPRSVLGHLIHALESAISDAQERLTYCAEVRLRQDIIMFEPLPSQLAYPELLQQSNQSPQSSTAPLSDDVSRAWYPALRGALALLSKLYGATSAAVFEDFACRCLGACLTALSNAADMLRKKSGQQIQGDLFLIRHLLILREQIAPFELKLQSRLLEKHLDFRPTSQATRMLTAGTRSTNASSLLRLDSGNPLLQWARDGLPGVQETVLDIQAELDTLLRNACGKLKTNALKMMLGGLEAFVVKIGAFIDESASTSTNSVTYLGSESADAPAPLSSETRAVLRAQAFMRPERVREVLLQAQETALHATPDFRELLKLYVENSVARVVLLKPILAEITTLKGRIESALDGCLDAGQVKRDLEQMLSSTLTTITSELSK